MIGLLKFVSFALSMYHRQIFENQYNERPSAGEDKDELVLPEKRGFKDIFSFENLKEII